MLNACWSATEIYPPLEDPDFVGYFVAVVLFYLAYKKDSVLSILYSCFLIFLFSVVLEIVQLYLPYRTFNPVDIAANGVGIVFFAIIWMVCWKKRTTEI
jgi:VanZ family protein